MRRSPFQIAVGFTILSGCLAAQQPPSPPPGLSLGQRAVFQLESTFSPTAFLASSASAGINQWRDHPWEWGQGMAGYGRRFAYRFARHGVAQGIELGVGALLGEDPRYFRSNRNGVWSRTRYALRHTFIVAGNGGEERFAISRMTGHYGSAWIANTWLPARLTGPGDVILRGTISIGWDAARNLFSEFWPDIRRKLPGSRR